MLNAKKIDELSACFGALLNAVPKADIEKNAKALLSGFFTRLDLVSREEFEIQAELLRRMQDRLKAVESQLATLRKEAASPSNTAL